MGSVADTEVVTFNGGRELTVREIYDNLILSLDIGFRYALGLTTDDDRNDPLYDISIDLFANPSMLPDGSALYGIVLHSRGVAIKGFGQATNGEGTYTNNFVLLS